MNYTHTECIDWHIELGVSNPLPIFYRVTGTCNEPYDLTGSEWRAFAKARDGEKFSLIVKVDDIEACDIRVIMTSTQTDAIFVTGEDSTVGEFVVERRPPGEDFVREIRGRLLIQGDVF